MQEKKLNLDEIKQVELGILEYVDELCQKHGLKYYLAYGTLLGAIRHKGFIPWDDDIDIYMMRDDYEKFMKIAHNNHDHYRLMHRQYDNKYLYEYAKVVDHRTKLTASEMDVEEDDGIWIDVFPLDFVPKHYKFKRFLLQASVSFRVMSTYHKFPSKRSKIWYLIWIIGRLIGHKPFLAFTDYLSRNDKPTEFVGYMASLNATSSKFMFPYYYIKDTVLVDFEGKKYPAPKYYSEYLEFKYGDYMKLPPEDKRVPHPVESYWRN